MPEQRHPGNVGTDRGIYLYPGMMPWANGGGVWAAACRESSAACAAHAGSACGTGDGKGTAEPLGDPGFLNIFGVFTIGCDETSKPCPRLQCQEQKCS